MANKVRQSVSTTMRNILATEETRVSGKPITKQFNVLNLYNISAASGSTPDQIIDVSGYAYCNLLMVATAAAQLTVNIQLKDGTKVSKAFVTGSAGTSDFQKFYLGGVDTIIVSVKDTSATANNKIKLDCALATFS